MYSSAKVHSLYSKAPADWAMPSYLVYIYIATGIDG